jgi:hypothetical protein
MDGRKRLHPPGSSKGARILTQPESGRKSPKPSFAIFGANPRQSEKDALPRVSIEEESPRVDYLSLTSPKK